MKKHINTFSKGINQDISVNKYSNENLYWAQNFRFISKDGLATGALTNVDGTLPKLNFGGEDVVLVGYTIIRDTLVTFIQTPEGGKIYIWIYNQSDYEESPVLIYSSPDLVFDIDHPVRAVGRYENEKVQKIYFTDGYSFFKHLNIVHPTLGLGAQLTYDASSLDMVSDVEFSEISLELVPGGNLKAGKIQYSYQLYSKRGSESVFSPASQLIHLTNADETVNSGQYYGEEAGTVVNKSVNVTIDNLDPLFTRLRLVALDYTVLYQQPAIRIVGEYNIENLTNITVTDSGTSIGELTIEEFSFIQNNFYPKTIDIKDDYLFAANIKNDYFEITDEEFDARAWRANSSDEVLVANGKSDNTTLILHNNGTFVPSSIPPVTAEQYNLYNDIDKDYDNSNKEAVVAHTKYLPGSAGTILGGKGVNVQYQFTIKQVVLDDSPNSYSYSGKSYPRINIGASAPFENNASPFSEVGYQRDEIYRFGIVFFDKKGRQSFVKWIGDIRFPSNRDGDEINETYAYATYDEALNLTYANILGIKFSVIIPEVVQSKISGYQIVRADRTNSDKTVIAQGLIGYPLRVTTGESEDANTLMLYPQATQCVVSDLVLKTSQVERPIPAYGSIGYADNAKFASNKIVYNPSWVEFDSPDVVINKPELPLAQAFIEVFGYHDKVLTASISGGQGYENNDYTPLDKRDIIISDKTRNVSFKAGSKKVRAFVTNSRVLQPKPRGTALENSAGEYDAPKIIIEDGQKYNNQAYMPEPTGVSAKSKWGMRGTYALLTVDKELPFETNWIDSDKLQFPLANYRVNRGRSIYGGTSYEAKTSTIYYPASTFIKLTDNVPITNSLPGESIPVDPVKSLQVLDAWGYQVLHYSTCLISTAKYFDFDLSNYGNQTITISSLTLSNTTDWYFAQYPSGTIAPGATVHGRVIYSGLEENLQSCIVTVNTDAEQNPYLFVLGVDYVNNPADYTGSLIEANVAVGDQTPVDGILTSGGMEVFKGDTYISYFAYMRSLYDVERGDGYRIEANVFYPIESTINLNLRLDNILDYINWGLYRDSFIVNYKLVENASIGVSIYGNNYPLDVGNLYRYNSVYTSIDKSKEFYPKPFDFESIVVNDTRILASEKKINGEYVDSWTKFKFNNYLDVDSKHNEIVKIITFKNYLFYFQPTAVGIAAVNQRSLINDNQPGALALGTGGILERFDYVTDKSGSEFYESIVASDNFLFYADGRRKRINKLVPGKEEAISVIKGIDSTLDKQEFSKVRAGFDRGFNEVVFAIDDNLTIGFSEAADAFMSSYTFNPGIMFSIGKEFFSTGDYMDDTPWKHDDIEGHNVGYIGSNDSDVEWDYVLIGGASQGSTLFKHNAGDPGSFYGQDGVSDSYLTLIINPEGTNVCYFDNMELSTQSVINGLDDVTDIFYRLEAENNYQSITRELMFDNDLNESTGSIKRIGRIWRTPLLPVQTSEGEFRRLVDSYLKVTLRYSNVGNKFRVHDITTMYRPATH